MDYSDVAIVYGAVMGTVSPGDIGLALICMGVAYIAEALTDWFG